MGKGGASLEKFGGSRNTHLGLTGNFAENEMAIAGFRGIWPSMIPIIGLGVNATRDLFLSPFH